MRYLSLQESGKPWTSDVCAARIARVLFSGANDMPIRLEWVTVHGDGKADAASLLGRRVEKIYTSIPHGCRSSSRHGTRQERHGQRIPCGNRIISNVGRCADLE